MEETAGLKGVDYQVTTPQNISTGILKLNKAIIDRITLLIRYYMSMVIRLSWVETYGRNEGELIYLPFSC